VTNVKLISVIPILQVTNLERSVDFYTRVLGFTLDWQSGEPPMIASVYRDGASLMLKVEAAPALSHVYFEMTGVDEYFARAAEGGARIVTPLADRFYGMRDGRMADPDGNELDLGEELAVNAA
jgi:uncharacterized glyoxalase superfamily protein PhnB